MIAAVPLLAAVALSGSAGDTDLRIVSWPQGQETGGAIVRRLRCDPPGGTLANAARACRRLAALRQPFAPVPKDVACTQVYGGPEEARVTGTFRGRRVWAAFRRNDGCEIARWNRHAFLFATG